MACSAVVRVGTGRSACSTGARLLCHGSHGLARMTCAILFPRGDHASEIASPSFLLCGHSAACCAWRLGPRNPPFPPPDSPASTSTGPLALPSSPTTTASSPATATLMLPSNRPRPARTVSSFSAIPSPTSGSSKTLSPASLTSTAALAGRPRRRCWCASARM